MNRTENTSVHGVGPVVGDIIAQAPFHTFFQKKPKYPLIERLNAHCKQLPVIGFNSGRYDINLNRESSLLSFLLRVEGEFKFTVKKANTYMCIATEHLKIVDESNFQAPGVSLESFLKSNDTEIGKFDWPYEWFDCLGKLDSDLPPKEAFWSTLKNRNTLGDTPEAIATSYRNIQNIWIEQGFRSMRDMLIFYNTCDVVPF